MKTNENMRNQHKWMNWGWRDKQVNTNTKAKEGQQETCLAHQGHVVWKCILWVSFWIYPKPSPPAKCPPCSIHPYQWVTNISHNSLSGDKFDGAPWTKYHSCLNIKIAKWSFEHSLHVYSFISHATKFYHYLVLRIEIWWGRKTIQWVSWTAVNLVTISFSDN